MIFRRNRYGYRRAQRWPLVVGIGLLVLVLAVGALVFTSGPGEDPAPTATPSEAMPESWPVQTREAPQDVTPGDGTFPDPAEVDRTNPDEVAEATAELFGSHDTLLDSSEDESWDRAEDLLAPEIRDLPEAENPMVGEEWLEAQQHEAYSRPLVAALNVPALTHDHEGETEEEHAAHADEVTLGMPTVTAAGEEALGYQFDVLYHWKGRDGWVSEADAAQKREVRLALVERDGVWMVAEAFYGSPRVTGTGVK